MECCFFSRPVDEEGKPVRVYRRKIHNIWKDRYGTEITEQASVNHKMNGSQNWN